MELQNNSIVKQAVFSFLNPRNFFLFLRERSGWWERLSVKDAFRDYGL